MKPSFPRMIICVLDNSKPTAFQPLPGCSDARLRLVQEEQVPVLASKHACAPSQASKWASEHEMGGHFHITSRNVAYILHTAPWQTKQPVLFPSDPTSRLDGRFMDTSYG